MRRQQQRRLRRLRRQQWVDMMTRLVSDRRLVCRHSRNSPHHRRCMGSLDDVLMTFQQLPHRPLAWSWCWLAPDCMAVQLV
jgi:hypothetical protein